jgi:hypothetical protein
MEFQNTPNVTPQVSRASSPVLTGLAATMNEIQKLTLRTKKSVFELLKLADDELSAPDVISISPRVLYSSADERPIESRVSASFRIHPDLITLAEAKQHIPLSMFTSSSTEKLWRDCASLRNKKINLPTGSKITIIATSQFPNENDIEIPEFHEAYQNLLILYKAHSDKQFCSHFENHYRFIALHNHFAKNFRALNFF